VVVSSAAARAAARLRLVFGDGAIDAEVREGVERAKRATYSAPGEQPKLL
jgi:hypothetical protein